ncbi:MAG: hypothetical protein ACKVS7_03130 [Gemmatimonadaceae bacterium]
MTRTMRNIVLRSAMALGLAACSNAGEGRVIGLEATGVVTGRVYFDANGSRTSDAEDLPQAGVRVVLRAAGGATTSRSALTGADGRFRLTGVPVGAYSVGIDTTTIGDSVRVVTALPTAAVVLPNDSVTVETAVGFPIRTAAQVRTLAPGTPVFVVGIALHARDTFSDTLLHVVDTSGALRATRVRPAAAAVVAGDSVRLRGRVAVRLGQRVLDDVSTFAVGRTFIPTTPLLTSAQAATASAGTRDAALIRLVNVLVTDTATVAGNVQMTVTDGSGAVVVVLDRAADVAFRAPLPAGQYSVGFRFDLSGVLTPTGTGTWRVRPRSVLDLVRR